MQREKSTRKQLILEDPSILKGLIIMAAPLFLSNMLKSLHDIVDSYFLARMDGTEEMVASTLAAINIHWPIYNIFNALGVGLGIAGVGIISQYLGSGKDKLAKTYGGKLLTYSAILGLIVNALLFFGAPFISQMMGAKGDTYHYAVTYFRYRSLEFTFVYIFLAYQAIRQASGDTLTPVILSVGAILVNMVLTWLFISVLKMGIAGAGLSTLISQVLIVPFAVYNLFFTKKHTRIELEDLGFDLPIVKEISKFAMPSAAAHAFSSLGFAVIQAMILSYGDVVSSGFSTGNRISSLLLNPVMAIGSVATAYIGQNIGNNNPKRAHKSYALARNLSVSLMVIGVLIIIPIAKPIAEFIVGNKNQAIVEVTVEYSIWILGTQPLMSIFQTYLSLFNGSGNNKYAFMMTFTRLWILRVPLVLIFKHLTDVGYAGIWYAMVISNLAILVVGYYFYKKVNFERKVRLDDVRSA
ncbi:MAG: MATE family efflux transporter [Acholeplasma sp.]|nr:MATE family efflux transporter [Acholeplasma sp.]